LQSGSIKEEISVNTIEKSMTIRILDKPKTSERGVNVFSQPNVDIVNGEPLFVIDGKVVADDGISNLKPDDIATMEVLKNASGTAIYGEKGKNGVVVITTKKVAQAKEESNFVIKGKQLYTIKIGNKRQIIDAKTANDYSTDRIMQVNVVKVGEIKSRKTGLNEYEEKVLKDAYDGWVDIWVREQ
jgi:TonB-dependent SusC/RagA subfamily outer membrane receptor